MKVVFSRKGVDSTAGGRPSPQFCDGSFVSIPIPYPHSPVRYRDIGIARDVQLGELVETLLRLDANACAHLDPDLRNDSRNQRHRDWKPAFGQSSGALTHLRSQGVNEGDLFLFYGWFQPVVGPPWRYRRHQDYRNGDFQAAWGWLEVGQYIDLDRSPAPDGNRDHPHANGSYRGGNGLFIASPRLRIPGFSEVSGGGVFDQLVPLTAAGAAASTWWFDKSALTKHRQEHVGDCNRNPELLEIVRRILENAKAPLSSALCNPSLGIVSE